MVLVWFATGGVHRFVRPKTVQREHLAIGLIPVGSRNHHAAHQQIIARATDDRNRRGSAVGLPASDGDDAVGQCQRPLTLAELAGQGAEQNPPML